MIQKGFLDRVAIPKKHLKVRIPYMGSKNKIALPLLTEMLRVKPNARYFYDLFGGGGCMSFLAYEMGLVTHYNELQTGLVAFLDYILHRIDNGLKGKYGLFPDDFYNFIDRQEFMKLRDEDSVKGQFARIVYTFGNNQRDYLFGKEKEKAKHLAHNIVVLRCEKSLKELNDLLGTNFTTSNWPTWNERRLSFIGQVKDRGCATLKSMVQLRQLERFQQLERLHQLERLEQLERLQTLGSMLTTSNLSYKDVKINTPIEETIIYIDPPYRNTAKYVEGKDLNYKELDQWFLDSKYTCFMSEYNAPHKVLFEIDKISLLNGLAEKRKTVKEKLFWNGC